MNKWILPLIALLLEKISGPLRDSLMKFAEEFRVMARQTPNKWDDLAADLICWLLGI